MLIHTHTPVSAKKTMHKHTALSIGHCSRHSACPAPLFSANRVGALELTSALLLTLPHHRMPSMFMYFSIVSRMSRCQSRYFYVLSSVRCGRISQGVVIKNRECNQCTKRCTRVCWCACWSFCLCIHDGWSCGTPGIQQTSMNITINVSDEIRAVIT